MIKLSLLKTYFLFAFAVTLFPPNADAASFNLQLAGSLSNAVMSYAVDDEHQYTTWKLDLSGLNASNSVTVAQGDFVNVTISLNQSFTFPGPTPLSIVTLLFGSFNALSEVTGTTQLFNGEVSGALSHTSRIGMCCSALANPAMFSNYGPIAFDTVKSNILIDRLASPVTLNAAELNWTVQSPVPELGTHLMSLGGVLAMLAKLGLNRR